VGSNASASAFRELQHATHPHRVRVVLVLAHVCTLRSLEGGSGTRGAERRRPRLVTGAQPCLEGPPVSSHPDSHGRFRNRTGSTSDWPPKGRGLSPPVGSCTPPRKRASQEKYSHEPARGGREAGARWRCGGRPHRRSRCR